MVVSRHDLGEKTMSATIQPRTLHASANALKLVVSFLLLLLFATRALAGESALAWDASPDPRVIGYNVYAGQASGSYSLKFDAGLATSYTVKNLAEGSTNYFAVTARDETGEESAHSNQASAKHPLQRPGADFSANVTSGIAPITVNFTSATTGTVTGYAWNFGDGGTSTQMNPAHAYAAPGTYTVSLTVNGPGGMKTATKQGYIVVNPRPRSRASPRPRRPASLPWR